MLLPKRLLANVAELPFDYAPGVFVSAARVEDDIDGAPHVRLWLSRPLWWFGPVPFACTERERMGEFALVPGWTATSQPFWLPSVPDLPVLSNRTDDLRNFPENMVVVGGDEFVLRDLDRVARLIVNDRGDRLTVNGMAVPETVVVFLRGMALAAMVDGTPFPVARDVVICGATQPMPKRRARAARLVLEFDPPLWRECPFASYGEAADLDDDDRTAD